jgi:hypothetical protein
VVGFRARGLAPAQSPRAYLGLLVVGLPVRCRI